MKYNTLIWYDGKFVEWQNATTSIMSHVVHYGSSIFESLRCYKSLKGSVILRLQAHVERLLDSAKIYRMDIPYTAQEFGEAIIQTVKKNNLEECYIRPFVFRGFQEMGINPLKNPVHCAIAAWEWGKYLGEEGMENGISACVSSWNRYAPNTLPSLAKAGGNYLNSQLIKIEAIENGFDEGIALDSMGYVSEGSGENIFLVRSGVLYTPPTSSSILAGITRHCVFQIARDLQLRIEQHTIPREALYIADEVFLTGTAAEITPITSIDRRKIGTGKVGPITKKIQEQYFGIIKGELEDKYNWLTYV
ncbi:MAG: branched-chain-amino-acid transaminase [bacterium]